jgi:hypothetical protein
MAQMLRCTADKHAVMGTCLVDLPSSFRQTLHKSPGFSCNLHHIGNGSFSGRMGSERMRFPVALKTAFATAAFMLTIPISPMPLIPSVLTRQLSEQRRLI